MTIHVDSLTIRMNYVMNKLKKGNVQGKQEYTPSNATFHLLSSAMILK